MIFYQLMKIKKGVKTPLLCMQIFKVYLVLNRNIYKYIRS